MKTRPFFKLFIRRSLCVLVVCLLAACSEQGLWNNPYGDNDGEQKVLYSSFKLRPKHLDPAKSYSANEYAFIAQIYEPPFQYHFLKRPYELIPATASQMPEIQYLNAEGEVVDKPTEAAFSLYTITIQQGIQYQPHPAFARNEQGEYLYHKLDADRLERIHTLADFEEQGSRELLSEDYVRQIKRLADPKLQSPVAGLFANYIEGFSEFAQALKQQREGDAKVSLDDLSLSGVKAVGDYQYQIKIKGSYPQFIYWMSMPFFAPMPWEVLAFYDQDELEEKNISLDWYPVGTGAFMLTENNPNLRMVLQRNPNFRMEYYPNEGQAEDQSNGLLDYAERQLPFLDKAVYSLEKENIPYWNKFLQGYYDNSGISSDSFDQAVQLSGGELSLTPRMQEQDIQLSTAVNSSVFYMGFNMLDPVVGGLDERARKLRQAVSIAVDYEEFISIFTNGRASPAQGPLPPGIYGFQEGEQGINPVVYKWKNGRAQRRYLSEAKQLMVEAGYPNGVDKKTGKALTLYLDTVGAGPDAKANLQWMIKQYAKLGIQLVVRNTDYNRFQEKMRKGTAQIFQWGWNADYPDPENFFFLLYGPNGKVNHQGENAANYMNPEFDALFDQMKNLNNGPQRLDLIKKMNKVVRRDAPWLFGFNPKSFSLYHHWYKNAKPNQMANNTLKYKDVDVAQRQAARQRWNQPVVWPVIILSIVLILSAVPAYLSYRRKQQEVLR